MLFHLLQPGEAEQQLFDAHAFKGHDGLDIAAHRVGADDDALAELRVSHGVAGLKVRQRLVLDPPEVLIRPELSLTILGFRQAREGIEAGERAAEAALPQLREVLAERSAG